MAATLQSSNNLGQQQVPQSPPPTIEVHAAPRGQSIKFHDNLARPQSEMTDVDEEAIEYDSDPEHAQDWTKTTDPKDSWAVKERRRSSIFHKGPEMPNPHAPNAKDRRGSVLSLFKSGKDGDNRDVITSGFEDDERRDTLVQPAKKDVRSMSSASNGSGAGSGGGGARRGSVLSLFQGGKDSKGRSVMNSGNWDDMD